MSNSCSAILLCVALASSGCTHLQLGRSTVRQASTITDLQYRQVLNGLAAIHANPDVLPGFAVVGTGGTSITDQAGINSELEWDVAHFSRKMLGLDASREVQEQWALAPVVNPDKLRAIRCVYQIAIFGYATDPEADQLLTSFLGDDYMQWIHSGWLRCGRRCDVPKKACYSANCGDCYIWVIPAAVESLSRLTIVVLDIATIDPNEPPAPATKTVEKYNYVDGKLDSIETYTRPDPEAPAPTRSRSPVRKDFYNPLQTQIQLGRGR